MSLRVDLTFSFQKFQKQLETPKDIVPRDTKKLNQIRNWDLCFDNQMMWSIVS